jgi:UDP-N-acetylglucosamine diphosphorylase/glucosamine-1-phosphate N-acetyltransferase
MWLILEEDPAENFWPLSLLRPTFELRAGIWSPLERALGLTPDVALRVRPELAADVRARTKLLVNEDIDARGIHAKVAPGLPYQTPWEILAHSADLIAADFALWRNDHRNFKDVAVADGAHVIGDDSLLHVGEGAVVQPGCVLDVSNGPIVIAAGAQVKYSQIQGPVFLGKNSIADGARLRPGTSIGASCKVGGEIAASIFQDFSNKSHDGFVGHSWAGSWVNFGALATTSNLKNTYGTIRFQRDGSTSIETGVQFLGSLVGDHTKIGIGQMLTTGSHIGAGCNIFGGGVAPRYIPSFCWGGAGGWAEHKLDLCLKTARATMERRKKELDAEPKALLRALFGHTASERAQFVAGSTRDAAV